MTANEIKRLLTILSGMDRACNAFCNAVCCGMNRVSMFAYMVNNRTFSVIFFTATSSCSFKCRVYHASYRDQSYSDCWSTAMHVVSVMIKIFLLLALLLVFR